MSETQLKQIEQIKREDLYAAGLLVRHDAVGPTAVVQEAAVGVEALAHHFHFRGAHTIGIALQHAQQIHDGVFRVRVCISRIIRVI
jgi:hypothetical protein